MRRFIAALFPAMLLAAAPAHGVIVMGGTGNNVSPPADPGLNTAWNLEGLWANVYLGTPIAPQFFITAAHIGGSAAAPFNFQGNDYAIDASYGVSGHYILPETDLAIWKITGTFPTYAPLYTGSNEIGQPAVIFGRGTARGGEVRDGSNALHGWLFGADSHIKSWGTNVISGIGSYPHLGDELMYDFDNTSEANEGGLSKGDSGGGVFIQSGGVWKLAGINYSVDGPYSTSSNGSNPFLAQLFSEQGYYEDLGNGVFELNTDPTGTTSYSSRISQHIPEILAAVPEPGGIAMIGAAGIMALMGRRRKS